MRCLPVLAVAAVTSVAAAAAATEARDCADLAAAHAALLASSFTCERHFTVRLNDELKVREIVRLTYRAGELGRETIERELLDDNLVLEEGDEEAALAIPFDCARIARREDGSIELADAEGKETVTFALDRGGAMLRPVRWVNRERERFLWKKFDIEAVADYQAFVWEPAAVGAGTRSTGPRAPGSSDL